jgi:hypothetical protein
MTTNFEALLTEWLSRDRYPFLSARRRPGGYWVLWNNRVQNCEVWLFAPVVTTAIIDRVLRHAAEEEQVVVEEGWYDALPHCAVVLTVELPDAKIKAYADSHKVEIRALLWGLP